MPSQTDWWRQMVMCWLQFYLVGVVIYSIELFSQQKLCFTVQAYYIGIHGHWISVDIILQSHVSKWSEWDEKKAAGGIFLLQLTV